MALGEMVVFSFHLYLQGGESGPVWHWMFQDDMLSPNKGLLFY